jgi:hypothetical protein
VATATAPVAQAPGQERVGSAASSVPAAGSPGDAPTEWMELPPVAAVREALDRAGRCVPAGEGARVEGVVDPASGRVVLARPPAGEPTAVECVTDALEAVHVAAPLEVRVDFFEAVAAPSSASPRGRIDADQVAAALHSRTTEVRACYERELSHDRTLEGHAEVHLRVDASGEVTRRTVIAPARFGAFGRCLQGVLRELSLPRPTGGGVELVFPFAFSPGGEATPEE